MQIWDTAGQERFRALIPNYIRDSSAVIIVFDVCEVSSFEQIENWYDESRTVRGSEVTIYLVANKTDREDRKVSTEEISKRADSLNIPFIEVSAKENIAINEMFKNLGMLLPFTKEETSHRESDSNQINLNKTKKTLKKKSSRKNRTQIKIRIRSLQ